MKMFLEILLLLFVAVLMVCLLFYFPKISNAPGVPRDLSGTVCFKDKCFDIELAETPDQREKGLMGRKELGKDKGMLFVFENESRQSFWMKNTLIPLDIIWIGADSKAVFINRNTQPCKDLICPSIYPQEKAKYVLEVNAGICDEIGLKAADELKIDIFVDQGGGLTR